MTYFVECFIFEELAHATLWWQQVRSSFFSILHPTSPCQIMQSFLQNAFRHAQTHLKQECPQLSTESTFCGVHSDFLQTSKSRTSLAINKYHQIPCSCGPRPVEKTCRRIVFEHTDEFDCISTDLGRTVSVLAFRIFAALNAVPCIATSPQQLIAAAECFTPAPWCGGAVKPPHMKRPKNTENLAS